MAELSKPFTITNPEDQAEDIDRMLEELYKAVRDVSTTSTDAPKDIAIAQVAARTLFDI